MDLSQKFALKKFMVPELKESLKILALPLPDLKYLVEEELANNPFLEETPPPGTAMGPTLHRGPSRTPAAADTNDEFDPWSTLAKAPTLQEVLLRQLETSDASEDERRIGKEIIGNIDEQGYLRASLDEIAVSRQVPLATVQQALKIIHQFEPSGVGARDLKECLLIQCDAQGDPDPLIRAIIQDHLEDVAKKKFEQIARKLDAALDDVEAAVHRITCLDPKPGRNFSFERACNIVPDIFIEENNGAFEIFINQEDIPSLYINEEYRYILKKDDLAPEAREYLEAQLQNALELLRALSRRQKTVRKVLEVIVQIQQDALTSGMSRLKPLTFQEVADKIEMHESTVCRVIMNKYAQTPQGIVALKDFFTSGIQQENGETVSSNLCKTRIKEQIDAEDKRHPLSDEDLARTLLRENGLKVARRTVAKYREELKILSSTLRRER